MITGGWRLRLSREQSPWLVFMKSWRWRIIERCCGAGRSRRGRRGRSILMRSGNGCLQNGSDTRRSVRRHDGGFAGLSFQSRWA